MGFLDRLFGRNTEPKPQQRPEPQPQQRQSLQANAPLTDEQALERYRYLLRTAPPEAIEQAHQEAFTQLTLEQRALALRELSNTLPASERAGLAPNQDDPKSLARLATRAELRQPGTMERTFGSSGPGMGGFGGGGMFGGSFMSSLAAGFVGSMVANQLYDSFSGGDAGAADGGADVSGDAAAGEPAADAGGFDGDLGTDVSGDFGGGDFGGDFGGGDF